MKKTFIYTLVIHFDAPIILSKTHKKIVEITGEYLKMEDSCLEEYNYKCTIPKLNFKMFEIVKETLVEAFPPETESYKFEVTKKIVTEENITWEELFNDEIFKSL